MMQQDVRRDFFFDILCVIYPLRISTTEPCARRMYQRVPGCCDFSNLARVFGAGHWEGSWSFFLGWKWFANVLIWESNKKRTLYVKTRVSICWCFLRVHWGPRWCLLLQALSGSCWELLCSQFALMFVVDETDCRDTLNLETFIWY